MGLERILESKKIEDVLSIVSFALSCVFPSFAIMYGG